MDCMAIIQYLMSHYARRYSCCRDDGLDSVLRYPRSTSKLSDLDLQALGIGTSSREQTTAGFTVQGWNQITKSGPQFIAKDFKSFIWLSGMTHVRTSPYYPQSNGKLERYHKSLKSECIRPKTPLNLEDAKRAVADFMTHYNDHRLHSAIGYVTPRDMLEGR